jgi:hypothetical protein
MSTQYQPTPTADTFKGMRRYRYYSPEHSLEDALCSPYVWWWRYLRMSKDYWWVCQRRGIADDLRLRAMHTDFGDVYSSSFAQWWQRRGTDLFMEQSQLAKVRQLHANDLCLSRDQDDYLLLEVPLFVTEKTLINQIRERLRKHEHRQVQRRSSARRQLTKYVGIKQDVIEIARQIWQAHYSSQIPNVNYKIGQVKGSKSLYQIGKEFRLVGSCMPKPGDTIERSKKRVNGMKVGVSRMLTRCDNLILNAAVGTFPSVKPLKDVITWRKSQQQRLDQAVESGAWHPLFDDEATLNVL